VRQIGIDTGTKGKNAIVPDSELGIHGHDDLLAYVYLRIF